MAVIEKLAHVAYLRQLGFEDAADSLQRAVVGGRFEPVFSTTTRPEMYERVIPEEMRTRIDNAMGSYSDPSLYRTTPDLSEVRAAFGDSTHPLEADAVKPNHYLQFAIEPIRFGVENYGPGVLIVKIVKYAMRYVMKHGHEDLAKLSRCVTLLRRYEAGDVDWWERAERTAPLPDTQDAPVRSRTK